MLRVLPLLAVLALGFAPLPFSRPDRRGKAVLAQFQGELQWVNYAQDGQEHNNPGVQVELVGDRVRYMVRGTVTAEYVVTLDPASNPPRIDFRDTRTRGRVLLGIYRLEGRTLRVRWASWGMPRPTAVDDDQAGHTLTGYRRLRR